MVLHHRALKHTLLPCLPSLFPLIDRPLHPSCALPPAETVHITERIFNHCYPEIRDWLNIPAMQGHLMKYGLLVTAQDMHNVGRDIPPRDKVEYLCGKAHGMKDGFHLLYLSIRESQDQHMGHRDAADELEECGKWWRICMGIHVCQTVSVWVGGGRG